MDRWVGTCGALPAQQARPRVEPRAKADEGDELTTLAEVGLDSLATVEAVMACEDEFGIEIDAESNPTTIGEFVSMVESLLEN